MSGFLHRNREGNGTLDQRTLCRSLLPAPPLIPIRPAPLPCQRHRGRRADLVPRGGAELQRLQPLPEQGDVVHRLRALVAAVGDLRREDVGAAASADAQGLGAERDADLVADADIVQQRCFAAAAVAEVDHAVCAVARDQRARQFVGGARKIGDEKVGGAVIDLVRGAHLQQLAVAHHADAVAERDRFGLVVGDIERGDAGGFQDAAEVVAQP